MPIRSNSLGVTQPRPVAEFAKMRSFRVWRFLAVSFLESLSSWNQGAGVEGRIAAPTTSGPARGPRPTSSTPRIATGFRLPFWFPEFRKGCFLALLLPGLLRLPESLRLRPPEL